MVNAENESLRFFGIRGRGSKQISEIPNTEAMKLKRQEKKKTGKNTAGEEESQWQQLQKKERHWWTK